MKPGFWHGVLAGAALTGLIAAAFSGPRPAALPVPATRVDRALPAEAPPRPLSPEPAPAGSSPAKAPPPAPGAPPPSAAVPPEEASTVASIRTLRVLPTLRMEADLPPPVAEWLDLGPAQLEELNRLFREDGRRIYALLRELAAHRYPGLSLPKEDTYRVPVILHERMQADPDGAGRWEDLVSSMVEIRRETLSKATPLLQPRQQERLARLLGTFFSFEGAFTFSR